MFKIGKFFLVFISITNARIIMGSKCNTRLYLENNGKRHLTLKVILNTRLIVLTKYSFIISSHLMGPCPLVVVCPRLYAHRVNMPPLRTYLYCLLAVMY